MEDPLDETLRRAAGDKTAKTLRQLGLETVGDLLFHFPRRYAEQGVLTDLSRLEIGDNVTVMAKVKDLTSRRMRGRKGTITKVTVTDAERELSLTFFNQPWLTRDLPVGRRGLFAGTVGEYRGERQLTHPQYAMFADSAEPDSPSADHDLELMAAVAGHLIPIYPATAKLASWTIAAAVKVVLDTIGDLPDPIP
ncbi:MAG TPA: ATP-dependent DNA helicase RecG, partial [Actinomycetes bacterium]|nr:ATP-dependent DNA helicase RecG [Actinomycetes bacterium]